MLISHRRRNLLHELKQATYFHISLLQDGRVKTAYRQRIP